MVELILILISGTLIFINIFLKNILIKKLTYYIYSKNFDLFFSTSSKKFVKFLLPKIDLVALNMKAHMCLSDDTSIDHDLLVLNKTKKVSDTLKRSLLWEAVFYFLGKKNVSRISELLIQISHLYKDSEKDDNSFKDIKYISDSYIKKNGNDISQLTNELAISKRLNDSRRYLRLCFMLSEQYYNIGEKNKSFFYMNEARKIVSNNYRKVY